MFLSVVSDGLWTLSARKLKGADAETLTDWLANVTSPRGGDRYTYLPPTATLTFVAYTSAVLLNRPLPPAAVRSLETSLADVLKPLLGTIPPRCCRISGLAEYFVIVLNPPKRYMATEVAAKFQNLISRRKKIPLKFGYVCYIYQNS